MSTSNLIRLYFVAIVLAAKFNDDLRLNNNDLAKIGGFSVKELSVLEIHFLKTIKFNMKVSLAEYLEYAKNFHFE